jgi:hypothetical protein
MPQPQLNTSTWVPAFAGTAAFRGLSAAQPAG